jgi:hypothetical protein
MLVHYQQMETINQLQWFSIYLCTLILLHNIFVDFIRVIKINLLFFQEFKLKLQEQLKNSNSLNILVLYQMVKFFDQK